MNEVDRFFDDEIKAIAVEGRAIALKGAEKLEENVKRQIKRNFRNRFAAFSNGVKTYDFDNGSYVRLSPILSSFASDARIEAKDTSLWILLPDGEKLGFRRLGRGFSWSGIKRRYGNRLRFVPVADGHVLLYKTPQGEVKPIYKLQKSVNREQKIEFFEAAERILEGLNG